jgi:hypothetical protein
MRMHRALLWLGFVAIACSFDDGGGGGTGTDTGSTSDDSESATQASVSMTASATMSGSMSASAGSESESSGVDPTASTGVVDSSGDTLGATAESTAADDSTGDIGATTGGTDSTGGAVCDENQGGQCQNCVAMECCDEFSTCNDDDDCECLFECIALDGDPIEECFMDCGVDAEPDGLMPALDCTMAQCDGDCS